MRIVVLALVVGHSGVAAADPEDVEVHGFASEGGFVSTANDYIGHSSRGSLELFEAGLNVSTAVTDQLRLSMQLFARDTGAFRDPPHFDFAYGDYRWRPWLGLRAGIIKMPFGLYNESLDVDAAHLPILMPQGLYSIRNREVLLSHTGFAVYGNRPLGGGGELDYQAWLGTLTIPENALTLSGATLDEIDTKYVTGAQVFWSPPVDGLRIGASYLRASIDFDLTLDPATVDALVMGGLVPADYDGAVKLAQRPDTMVVGSLELQRDAWLLAAEYGRSFKRQVSNLPDLIPEVNEDAELFYVMGSYRFADELEAGAYVSVSHADADDRRGHDDTRFAEPFYAFQRDAAATVEYDVNDHWLWKVEGHFIDGTADLPTDHNPAPVRRWGLFLFKTTLSF